MKIAARIVFLLSFLALATLPFDPLLNRPYVVYPLCAVCASLGLAAMYLLTLPDKPQDSQRDGRLS
jgi:hypothetical protein